MARLDVGDQLTAIRRLIELSNQAWVPMVHIREHRATWDS